MRTAFGHPSASTRYYRCQFTDANGGEGPQPSKPETTIAATNGVHFQRFFLNPFEKAASNYCN